MKIQKKNKYAIFLLVLQLFIITIVSGCSDAISSETVSSNISYENLNGSIIHFIDVGQADCILIQADGEAMLIDSGNRSDGDKIISYLHQNNIDSLKYIIATHPHEDHIGSMSQIINAFSVEEIIMPPKEHTTRTFEAMITAIENNNLSVTLPIQGNQYSLGEGQFTIVSTNNDYGNNLNDWSVSILYQYGDIRFLSCGDLEVTGEKDILASNIEIQADLLKISHHGSRTSSSESFLAAIAPEYGIIMCGQDNDYGHPHEEIVERLGDFGISLFRTDEQGTVRVATDGTSMSFSTQPAIVLTETTATETQMIETIKEIMYVLNTNTKKIHLADCTYSNSIKEENKSITYGSYEGYLEAGFETCKSCNP